MTWFSYSLISVVALAAAELIQQYLLGEDGPFDEISSSVLTTLVQSLFTLPLVFLLGFGPELTAILTPELLPYLILLGIVSSAGTVLYMKGLSVENISFSGILFSFSIVVSTTLGIIFFAESTSGMKLLGLLLILVAIVSVNVDNLHLEKNHTYAFIGGLLFGVVYTIDKKIVGSISPLVYLFWAFFIVAMFVGLVYPKRLFADLRKAKPKDYLPICLSGAGYFLYNFSTFKAYTLGGEVGRIDAINNSQVFLIILFEYFVMKHTEGLLRKILTAIVALAGVIVLGNVA